MTSYIVSDMSGKIIIPLKGFINNIKLKDEVFEELRKKMSD